MNSIFIIQNKQYIISMQHATRSFVVFYSLIKYTYINIMRKYNTTNERAVEYIYIYIYILVAAYKCVYIHI